MLLTNVFSSVSTVDINCDWAYYRSWYSYTSLATDL